MTFPMTAVYAKFVKAGLVDHLDQHGKAADLPGYVKDESRDLAPYLRERLTHEFKKQIRRINDSNGSELLKIPDYKGDMEPKVFLQEVLSVAEKEHIEGASSALESKICGQVLACVLRYSRNKCGSTKLTDCRYQ